jgi:hypothetical protein
MYISQWMAAIKVYRTHQKRTTWRGDRNWDWYMGPGKKLYWWNCWIHWVIL